MMPIRLGEIDNMHGFKPHFRHTFGLIQRHYLLILTIKDATVFFLLNVVCKNSILHQYMACGKVLLNRQNNTSIGKALSRLDCNIKTLYKEYNIARDHNEILLDFDEAECNAISKAFAKEINNILQGCSVHFLRSAMSVAKLMNLSTSSQGYHIFMSIAKKIRT